MKQTISFFISFLILLIIPFSAFSQVITNEDSIDENKLTDVARKIMSAAKTCALITIDDEGIPWTRAMDPFQPEDDFTVWFGTNPKSRKVEQIKNNSKVSLYYLESNESGYVLIHGTAELIDDKTEKEKRWKDEWEAFYQNRTTDYLLIKVIPKWMEVISYANGIVSESKNWEAPRVEFE